MSSRCDRLNRQRILFGPRLPRITCGLMFALALLGLSGCDKIKIPGIGDAAPAPAAPVAATPAAAPAALPAAQQPMPPAAPPEVPKIDAQTKVKNFLELTRKPSDIEDKHLIEMTQSPEGLDQIDKLLIPGAKITNAGMTTLAKFPKLTVVDVSNTEIGNEGVAILKQMPLMEVVGLNKTKVNDVGLASIADHPSIKELRLSTTGISDKGLALLDKLPNLESLDISYTSITGAGFDKFTGNKKLRVLHAQHSGIMPGAFKFLKGAPIEDLDLDVTGTNDMAMQWIGGMKKMKSLKLGFTGVTDQGLAKMSGMKDLEYLSLHNTKGVSSRSLNPLKTSKKLKHLVLIGTLVTPGEAALFKKLIGPDLQIDQ